MSSSYDTFVQPTNFEEAADRYEKSGKNDGEHRLINQTRTTFPDFINSINETKNNMYARDYILVKNGSFKPTLLRNWTSVTTNFETWVFERIDENMKKVTPDIQTGACIIPKHYIIKNKLNCELDALMNAMDEDSPFHNKVKEYMNTKYPRFHTVIGFNIIMGEKKTDMVMPTLTIMYIEKN